MFRIAVRTGTERRMFRRAVQAQREGCSGELYRHRERDVQENCIGRERDVQKFYTG